MTKIEDDVQEDVCDDVWEDVCEDVWQFEVRLTRNLMRWSVISIVSGAVMPLLGSPLWRGIGIQFAGWGLVDGALASLGLRRARHKAALPDARTAEAQAAERRKLRTSLWINTGLDVGYVIGGLWFARTKGRKNRFLAGNGWGIVVQGGFLLLYDLANALYITQESVLP